tara:strand:- start:281 stop:2974 length:2694 start_codon:yes stop_codon:yes gene_type:complete
MGIKYKSSRTSSGFRNIGQGISAGERRLKEQLQIGIDAAELARLQHKENTSNFISGMNSQARFEEGVTSKKQTLSKEIRTHQYETLSKKAQTDVDRLLGIAQQKKDYADAVKDYAPKLAKNLGKLAEGVGMFARQQHAQGLYDAANESGLIDKQADLHEAADIKLQKEQQKKLLEAEGTSSEITPPLYATYYNRGGGSSNGAYGKVILDEVKTNKNKHFELAKQAVEEAGGTLTKDNYVAWMKYYAHIKLQELGASNKTKAGKAFINLFAGYGHEQAYAIQGSEDADSTESIIKGHGDKLVAMRANPAGQELAGTELSTEFNNAVIATVKGTFRGENDKIIRQPYVGNKAAAFEGFSKEFINKHYDRFADETELREFFGRITIPGDDNQYWTVKHAARFERVVEHFNNVKSTKTNRDQKLKESAEDDAFIKGFDTRYAEWQEKKKDPTKYPDTPTLEEFFAQEVGLANQQSGGSTRSKNYIYQKAGLTKNFKSPGVYSSIASLYYGGNKDDAYILYAAQTPAVQARLKPYFESFKLIDKANYSSGDKIGVDAMQADIKKIIQTAEGEPGSGTNASRVSVAAKRVEPDYFADVVDEYLILVKTPEYKDNHNKAMMDAFSIVKQKFDDGSVVNKTKNPEKWKASKYRRDSSAYGDVAVAGQSHLVYMEYQDDTAEGGIVAEILNNKLAREDLRDSKVTIYESNTLERALRNNFLVAETPEKSFTKLLFHPRTVSPDTVKDWDGKLQNGEIPEPTENLKILARYDKSKTVTDLQNILLEEYKYDTRILGDDLDATKLVASGANYDERDYVGLNFYAACQAQNINAMSPVCRHFAETGVKYKYFKESTGLDWIEESGYLQFSDVEKALKNNIFDLNLGTPTEILNSTGLLYTPFTNTIKGK